MAPPVLLLALVLATGMAAPPAGAHPMHTAVAEIVYDDATRIATIQVRVFADDFAAVVPGTPGQLLADSAAARYVRASFTLRERGGRPLPLEWVRAELAGDVVLLQLRAGAPAGLGGGSVTSRFLCERFRDQVNIVRVTYRGHSTTLLFTPGDDAKPLP